MSLSQKQILKPAPFSQRSQNTIETLNSLIQNQDVSQKELQQAPVETSDLGKTIRQELKSKMLDPNTDIQEIQRLSIASKSTVLTSEERELLEIRKKRDEKLQAKKKAREFFEQKIRHTGPQLNLSQSGSENSNRIIGKVKAIDAKPTTTAQPFMRQMSKEDQEKENGKLFGFTQAVSPILGVKQGAFVRPNKPPMLSSEERELAEIRAKAPFQARPLKKRLFAERSSISSAMIPQQQSSNLDESFSQSQSGTSSVRKFKGSFSTAAIGFERQSAPPTIAPRNITMPQAFKFATDALSIKKQLKEKVDQDIKYQFKAKKVPKFTKPASPTRSVRNIQFQEFNLSQKGERKSAPPLLSAQQAAPEKPGTPSKQFIARIMPNFQNLHAKQTDQSSTKNLTVPQAFSLSSQSRGVQAQQKLQSKIAEREQQDQEQRSFKAKTFVKEKTFDLMPSAKPPTTAIRPQFTSDSIVRKPVKLPTPKKGPKDFVF